MYSRRRLMASIGTVATSMVIGGCLDGSDGGDGTPQTSPTPSTTPSPTPSPTPTASVTFEPTIEAFPDEAPIAASVERLQPAFDDTDEPCRIELTIHNELETAVGYAPHEDAFFWGKRNERIGLYPKHTFDDYTFVESIDRWVATDDLLTQPVLDVTELEGGESVAEELLVLMTHDAELTRDVPQSVSFETQHQVGEAITEDEYDLSAIEWQLHLVRD